MTRAKTRRVSAIAEDPVTPAGVTRVTVGDALRVSHQLALTAATAIAPMVWGTTYSVTTELLPANRPLFAALMRSLPIGLLAILLTRVLPRRDWWWKAAVLGMLNIGSFFPLLFIAAERLPGGVAATLGAAQPLFVTGLAVVMLGERLSLLRLAWGVVGLVGVGLVVLGPDVGFDPFGILAGLVGACAMGVGMTLTKRWGRPAGISPISFAAWQLAVGGLALLPATLLVEGLPSHVGISSAAGYLWLGAIGGLLAYALWFRGIGRLPVTSAALLGLVSPLVAALMGMLLGERLNSIQVFGFVLALIAVVGGSARVRPIQTDRIQQKATLNLVQPDKVPAENPARFRP
ncbi:MULTISPECIES: EamA family transporter [unclassified Nocardioides]|uniref:EamA family transporter n=1 Tax=unclassified Nocardioides TaxID=2615069 RepID=UPI00005702C1|nr:MULTISPECIES: EamA family transporter [unclassified Nocardioides]ABL80151.1 protein of unknown function DUF6, transmembrane [Nocardioides sp. JS614]